MELKNKSVLLSGASSGIGFELVKQLALEGCDLFLLARRKNILDELAENLKKYENEIYTYKCDVSNKEEVKQVFEIIKNKTEKIDIAILNSGTSYRMEAVNFNSEFGKNIFDVNVMGMIYCIEEILPDFLKRKSGMIVGVSSLADSRGFPRSAFYTASKAASSKLLESLRVELSPYNVKILTVKPGFVKTPMTDKNEFYMPFLMNVEKAAKKIIKGIKKENKIIQFPFPIVLGSKIVKIIPNFLFDRFALMQAEKSGKVKEQ